MSLLWVVLSLLVVVGAVLIRLRIHDPPGHVDHRAERGDHPATRGGASRRGARRGTALDDDAIRRIEETGRLRTREPEPLDQDAIDEAERRFWEEEWDEPEEF